MSVHSLLHNDQSSSAVDTVFTQHMLTKYFWRNPLRWGHCWPDTKWEFSEVTGEHQRPSICSFRWLNYTGESNRSFKLLDQDRDVWGYNDARQYKVFLRTTETCPSTSTNSFNTHVPSTVCSTAPGPCSHGVLCWFDCVHSETWSHFKDRGGRALKARQEYNSVKN